MKAIIASLLVGYLMPSTFAFGKVVPHDVSPPGIKVAADVSNLPESVRTVIAIPPELPLGPADLLHGYEDDMRAVSARFVNELAVVSKAFTERQMTRDQAEHFSEERYMVAMMQFELLSALHAQMEQEIERKAIPQKDPGSTGENPTAVVEPHFPSFHLNKALARQLELSPAQIRAVKQILFDEQHKQEPLLELLQNIRELLQSKRHNHTDEQELHTLARSEADIISRLMSASVRMQARMYEILNADQKSKLERFQPAKAKRTGAECVRLMCGERSFESRFGPRV